MFDEELINDFEINADFDFDFDLADFGDILDDDGIDTRYISPPVKKNIKVKYEYAKDLAKEISLEKNARTFAFVSGNFIFGDFVEALMESRDLHAEEMYIVTLSLSENNVDSFANIMLDGKCDSLNMIVSAYFYSHERQNLIPYLYQELDKDDKFQLAVCGTHCKIALIKCQDKYYVIHGSANLRSSNNLEQFEFEESEELYNFNKGYLDEIIDQYKTINKPVRGGKLWQVVARDTKK